MQRPDEDEDGGPIRIEWDGGPVNWIMVVKSILAYVLFMHHQIPLPLDQLGLSTTENIVENTELETFSLPRERRERLWKARAIKREMKRREKLVQSIQALLAALQGAFQRLSYMPSVLLILGSSSRHPRAAYEIQFHGSSCMHFLSQYEDAQGLGKSRSQETLTKSLSKRITRALISEDKGPLLTVPMKLFLFIKADATSCIQDFVPNRCFTTQSRKTQALLRVIQVSDASSFWHNGELAASSRDEETSCYNEIMWFQCKFKIRGGQCHDAT